MANWQVLPECGLNRSMKKALFAPKGPEKAQDLTDTDVLRLLEGRLRSMTWMSLAKLVSAFGLVACSPSTSSVTGEYELVGKSPWCVVDDQEKTIQCRYFSEQHCRLADGAKNASAPTRLFCVPKP